MLKTSVFVCCLYFCALTPYLTNALTAEQMAQIHAHFEAVGKICVKDNPIGAKDIESLRARQKPSGENAPCFLACLMKNIGFMDANGMLQKESALELAKNIFPDPDELKMVEDYLHSCSHINNEAVSDAEKGCDRAIMAYTCMMENASQFGFDI
ncbi:general odorant-binding protein 28a-like isoform X2 [Trichoplusia ni]|uniref:General odorant-binding protein 28a-like isoform X2 n=1 Tax=Trichoplusia ni TaxID=7111 RepID=A0A7E5VR81_TRINI|nr:general odorant-binding protein 28a-like isoform X2 [Trichoplusia ni]